MDETTTDDNGTPGGPKRKQGPPARAKAPLDFQPRSEKLIAFLIDLFETGYPTKVSLHACFGPAGKRLGPAVKEFPFKANAEKPTREALVEMSNLIVQLAQEEADVLGKFTRYAVLPFDLARSPTAYGRCMFAAHPTGTSQELAVQRGEADDEEDGGDGASAKLLERLLDAERRDKRWMMELTMNTLSGVLERDQARIEQQQEALDGSFERSTKYIAATEEALSKAHERQLATDRAKFYQDLMEEGVKMVKGVLPAVKVYLTKGKMGIAEGVKEFIDELPADVEVALLGEWDKGKCLKRGLLEREQVALIIGIAEGEIDPLRYTDFVSSLTSEQMEGAQKILTGVQVQSLFALAKAANDVVAKKQAEQEAESET